ncbi:hypothetical protein SEA_NICEHOUSE_223 [Rhodococcus phage NiceHouse]|nr:hypothetical protein SEA_NICEHOUSE_223 [Rhodococcus phage NiceHouse]
MTMKFNIDKATVALTIGLQVLAVAGTVVKIKNNVDLLRSK